MLALVVNKERPDLEETKTQLIIQNNEFTIQLKQLEDDLLYKLSAAEGDLTEDVELIESLEKSKRVAEEISQKVTEAKETEVLLNENRDRYSHIAARGAMLFFLLNSLNKIHAFYQFSLNNFVSVFSRGIDVASGGRKKVSPSDPNALQKLQRRMTNQPEDFEEVVKQARRSSVGSVRISRQSSRGGRLASSNAPIEEGQPSDEEIESPGGLEKRLEDLLESCTYTVFTYTRRGLFDKDKLTFLSLLTFSIYLRNGGIDAEEYAALCSGGRSTAPPPITDDLSRWMNESQWAALDALTNVKGFGNLAKDMEKASDEWYAWNAHEKPEKAKMPSEWGKLSDFRRLLVIRALRPDRISCALLEFCEARMGEKYVNEDAFDAAAMMKESTSGSPIFFVLFPGYSPSKEIEACALSVLILLSCLFKLSLGRKDGREWEIDADFYGSGTRRACRSHFGQIYETRRLGVFG